MTLLGLISTPRLRRLLIVCARFDCLLGLRIAIANELWQREELDRVIADARLHFGTDR